MNNAQTIVYSDCWEHPEQFFDQSHSNSKDLIDLIKLSSYQRVISNYVNILTEKNIPVLFQKENLLSSNEHEIFISSKIECRKDLDRVIGLALYEGAKSVLTDFSLVQTLESLIPNTVWRFGHTYKIPRKHLFDFIKTIFHIIEKWYVDNWVMSKAPGYIGYYESSYDSLFNTPTIDKILIGPEFRYPNLKSYEFRIVNFTNVNTDLNALPGLYDIAKIIDISNISRLLNTKNRMEVAFNIVEIVLKHIKDFHKNESFSDSLDQTESDVAIKDISDIISNRPLTSKTAINSKFICQPSSSNVQHIDEIASQLQFISGKIPKTPITSEKHEMLDLIEDNNISLNVVPVTLSTPTQKICINVECIVVKKLTMKLICSEKRLFPLSNFWRDTDGRIRANADMESAVVEGLNMGLKLGRKLLIRRESNNLREIHKRFGKIYPRLLHSVGYGAEDIFQKTVLQYFAKGSLHITVDASASMRGAKWAETLKVVAAICKATSMIDNIHTTVSFRATTRTDTLTLPYILIGYDSKVDKISKIRKLFPYLSPFGGTPEGLAYGAIMDYFSQIDPDEEDRYFLNISDGEPYFPIFSSTGSSVSYSGAIGTEHTKSQMNKIRSFGIKVLSYYVSKEFQIDNITIENFKRMYGKDAKFIHLDNISSLATTINALFLPSL